MSDDKENRPGPLPLPGTWPASSFQTEYLTPHDAQGQGIASSSQSVTQSSRQETAQSRVESSSFIHNNETADSYFARPTQDVREFPIEAAENVHTSELPSPIPTRAPSMTMDEPTAVSSSEQTIAPSLKAEGPGFIIPQRSRDILTDSSSDSQEESDETPEENGTSYEPIRTGQGQTSGRKSPHELSRKLTEQEIFKVISRRNTSLNSRRQSYVSGTEEVDDQQEIERLMSRMFGQNRQAQSEDEKTRHVGVIFKNLTVKGMGLGAALQPSVGDPFMNPFRLIKGLFSNPRNAVGKPPVRNLLHNFNGCIKPGEMLLVLGKPG